MPLKITTTICNIDSVDRHDFASEDDWQALADAEDAAAAVTVDCCATEGYYDITLATGRQVVAVSYYHLDGFIVSGPDL